MERLTKKNEQSKTRNEWLKNRSSSSPNPPSPIFKSSQIILQFNFIVEQSKEFIKSRFKPTDSQMLQIFSF